MIEVWIKDWVGNKVKWERYNDGLRYPIDQPYRPSGRNAHFRLPNGKKKCEMFPADFTDEQVLEGVRKKYMNFKNEGFSLFNSEQNPERSVATKMPNEQNDDKQKTHL